MRSRCAAGWNELTATGQGRVSEGSCPLAALFSVSLCLLRLDRCSLLSSPARCAPRNRATRVHKRAATRADDPHATDHRRLAEGIHTSESAATAQLTHKQCNRDAQNPPSRHAHQIESTPLPTPPTRVRSQSPLSFHCPFPTAAPAASHSFTPSLSPTRRDGCIQLHAFGARGDSRAQRQNKLSVNPRSAGSQSMIHAGCE